jgi:hypothetical protein
MQALQSGAAVAIASRAENPGYFFDAWRFSCMCGKSKCVSDLQSNFKAVASIVSGFVAVCHMTFLVAGQSKTRDGSGHTEMPVQDSLLNEVSESAKCHRV